MPDKMTPYKKQLADNKSYLAQNKWADCQGVAACQIFLHIVKRISAELIFLRQASIHFLVRVFFIVKTDQVKRVGDA